MTECDPDLISGSIIGNFQIFGKNFHELEEEEWNTSWRTAHSLAGSFKLLVLLFILARILHNLILTLMTPSGIKGTVQGVHKKPDFLKNYEKHGGGRKEGAEKSD